jgi:hypothetical protein
MLSAAKRQSVRPYTLRVHRDHGGGLWTFEADDGQLYLAVKSREFEPISRSAEWPTEQEVRLIELGRGA